MCVFVLASAPITAYKGTTEDGVFASDFATDFPTAKAKDKEAARSQVGPAGIAFSKGGKRLFVIDEGDSCLYRFNAKKGGAAGSGRTKLACYSSTPGGAGYSGITFDKSGKRLFISQQTPGGIYEVDVKTGAVKQKIADLPGVGNLAVSPVTGDLFAAQATSSGDILRFRFRAVNSVSTDTKMEKSLKVNQQSLPHSMSRNASGSYASPIEVLSKQLYSRIAPNVGKKSMAFDPYGMLYVTDSDTIFTIPLSRRPSAKNYRLISGLKDVNGITISPDFKKLFVNHNSGSITEIDLATLKRRKIFR